MSSFSNAVRPEDILSESESTKNLNGVEVRKGTIAAFLKNIEVIENSESSEQNKNAALDIMRELAPAVIAAGVYKYATFKNVVVQEILEEGYKKSGF